MIADWRTATQAAERARKLGIWGLHELTMSLQREELALGFRRGQPDAPADVAAAQRDDAGRNAQRSRRDDRGARARAQEMMLAVMVRNAENEVTKARPDAFSDMPEEDRARYRAATVQALKSQLPKVDRLFEVGAVRWERVLKHARLQAPPTRPVPEDLDQALAEIVSLRHVLTHRGGRVDHGA